MSISFQSWKGQDEAEHSKKMPKVTLVDYGLGNIQAFYNIYKQLNIKVNIASTPSHLEKSEKIILPGVGSFDWAMSKLNKSGLREVLDEMVITKKIPILGVCVGMQMMSSQSEEGDLPGLGWVDASVVKFSNKNFPGAPLPHMGWNDVYPKFHDGIFNGITEPCFYFLHSYYYKLENINYEQSN